jgi:hypothetical protein
MFLAHDSRRILGTLAQLVDLTGPTGAHSSARTVSATGQASVASAGVRFIGRPPITSTIPPSASISRSRDNMWDDSMGPSRMYNSQGFIPPYTTVSYGTGSVLPIGFGVPQDPIPDDIYDQYLYSDRHMGNDRHGECVGSLHEGLSIRLRMNWPS